MIGRPVHSDQETTRIDPSPAAHPVGLSSSSLMFQPLPARIARFEIVRKLGEGGMGVVYEANDPELGRRVAIKVMRNHRHGEHGSHGKDRMLREAKTMARLSHPNVVQVYEVDEFGDAVFLAMELVEGLDLRHWLKLRRHPWRDVLAVFIQAGQGLAAAHAVGVVHRDFKPDNVLVGDDGRVRVLDFGLARPLRAGDVDEVVRTGGSGNRITLTQANSYVGTPAYMSPEQHLHTPADARSDQFSFCVALWEALYGERPFAGRTAAEVRAAVFRDLPPPPKGRRVPAHLRKILVRGLRVAADERFPDMPALLAALAVDPRRPWKRAGLVVATLAVAGVGAASYARWEDHTPQCNDGAALLAPVWNEARAKAGAVAFDRTGVAYAAATWPTVRAELDAYAAAWARQRDDACLATHARGEASLALLDLRNECLDDRLAELAALVDAFTSADATTVERAVQAATGLPPLSSCTDEAYVSTRLRPAAGSQLAVDVAQARERLAQATAAREAGHPLAARDIATSLEHTSQALGFAPLTVEILLELGRCEEGAADYALAVAHLKRAYLEALAIGHDTVAADAALTLMLALHRMEDLPASLAWSEHAGSMVQRTGNWPAQQVPYLLYRSYILDRLDRHDEAIAAATEGLHIAQIAFSENDPRIGRMTAGLAHAHWNRGDDDKALELFERSKEVWRRGLGPDHPFIASSAINVSSIYYERHAYSEALAEARPALAIMKKAYGDDHPSVANLLGLFGAIAVAQGRFAEAIGHLERSREIRTRRLSASDPQALDVSEELASALRWIGRVDEALALQRDVLTHRETAEALLQLAEILADLRRNTEAEVAFHTALAAGERDDKPALVLAARTGLASLARRRGELDQADTRTLEALGAAFTGDPADRAAAQVERGETLLARGRADEAVVACKEALLALESAYGQASHQVVPALRCLGALYTARAQTAAARDVLTRAAEILDTTDIRASDRADAHAALAVALATHDPDRAAELRRRAIAEYTAAGPLFAADARRIAR